MPDGVIVDNVPDDITQEALLSQYQTFKGAPAPVEQPGPELPAQPGSISYALQGAGAGLETAGRMVGQLAGAGAGALGAGAAAIPDVLAGRTEQAAEGIRRGMAEGSQKGVAPFEMAAQALTGRPTIYAPTKQFEESLGKGMEALQAGLGTAGEIAETARGTLARKITPEVLHPYVREQPEAARTLAEYAFEASAVAAPFAGLKGMARTQAMRQARVLGKFQPAPPLGGPREIARHHLDGLKEVARDSDPKAYVVPDVETPAIAGAEVPISDVIRQFQQRGGETGVGPLTEAEANARAVRDFQAGRDPFAGPGKRQAGALNVEPRQPVEKTVFEQEQGLEAGQGLALPDLITPLDLRAVESLKIGRDLAAAKGKSAFEQLPTDMSKLSQYAYTTEHLTKFVGINNPLLKATIDRIVEKSQAIDSLREDLLYGDRLKPGPVGVSALRYTKREKGAGFKGPLAELGWDTKLELTKLNLESDAAREYLTSKEQQWLSREDMAQRGYSDAAITAHLHEQAYMDTVFDIVNHARALGGKFPLKKIPGWLPHTRAGHMRIKILRRMTDGSEAVVYYGKSSARKSDLVRAAQKTIDELKDQSPGVEFRPEIGRADDAGGMAELIDHFESVAQIYAASDKKFSQMIANSLNKRIAGMEQGFLQEGLRRFGVKGWIGETGITKNNLNQLMKLRGNYIENAMKYLKSQEIQAIRDNISPAVWNDVQKHLPKTADFIAKFTDVARENVPLNEVDKWILDIVSDMSFEGARYRWPIFALNKLRGLFSIKDLAWSVSYHTINAIQPEMFGSSALMREAARMGKGNPALAIMYAEKNIWAPSLEAKARIEWAAKHKVHSARLMEEIDFWYGAGSRGQIFKDILTGRRMSEINEAFGRLKTYLMGTEFYRQTGMTELQARQAAVKLTNDVMVDYSAVGQPLWLSNNPGGAHVGRLVAPYAAFQFSFLGHLALAIQAIKRNPGLARKFLPLISQQMAIGTVAGLRGLTGVAEISIIAGLFNNWWQSTFQEKGPLPDPMEVLLRNKVAGDFLLFGAVGAASKQVIPGGVDLTKSAGSPDISSLVVPRVITGVVDTTTDALIPLFKLILGQNMTDSEKLRALKSVTLSSMSGLWEAAFAPDVTIKQAALGQASGMNPDPRNRLRGVVERSPAEWATQFWTARPSLRERREMMAQRTIRTSEMRGTARKADITELAADFYRREGYIDSDLLEKATDEGYTPRQFRARVKELVRGTSRTRLERMQGKTRTKTRDRIREQMEDFLDDLEQ